MSLKDFFSGKSSNKPVAPPQEPDGRLSLKEDNFAGLIRMFHSQAGSGAKAKEGSLPAALFKASQDRTAKNVYDVAFKIYAVLRPFQIHFMGGGEDLFDDSVRKMKILAEEAAGMDGADANACNLAGIINADTWGFKNSEMYIEGQGSVDLGYKERAPASVSDLPAALKWFEKGVALGGESEVGTVCRANAERAQREIAAAQNNNGLRSEPPTPG